MLLLTMFLNCWTNILQRERLYNDFGGWYFCGYEFCILQSNVNLKHIFFLMTKENIYNVFSNILLVFYYWLPNYVID